MTIEPLLPNAREIVPGLWRWTAFHPAWKQDVGCVALESGEGLVLVDPLVLGEPPGTGPAWEALGRAAAGRSVGIVLTIFYHQRSACEILPRHPGATLWAVPEKSDEIACEVTHPFRPGDRLPGGLEALETGREGEIMLWEPRSGTLIPGDVLLGAPEGGLMLCPEDWLQEGYGLADLARTLAPLLVLPIQRVLVAHGEPVLEDARAALERAIQRAPPG
jgi:glyoxylase-like metal-dependent hydrolase (beta-lactamase superfamily II)